MEIEFDPAKNRANLREHKIDLADVEGVFYDQNAITLEDRDHSEQRFVTLGMDGLGGYWWFVTHTEVNQTFALFRLEKLSHMNARPTRDDTMKTTYDFSQGKRGAIIPASGKTRITIHIDDDVLESFRLQAAEQGKGYQTLINESLRHAIMPGAAMVTIENLRQVLREELRAA
jgi:uncharacterized DUF497 family protein